MEEEKEEKKEKVGIFAYFKYRKFWRWQLIGLFIFLIGFGILAYFLLGSQAYRLVRAPGGESSSYNTFNDKSENIAQKLYSFFSSQENTEVEKKVKTGFSFEDSSVSMITDEEVPSKNVAEGSKTFVSLPAEKAQSSSFSASKKESSSRLASSLEHRLLGADSIASSKIHSFSENGNSLASVIKNRQESIKTFTKSKGNFSALDSLKGAWKASIYGARLTSQDSAKSWTAKVFEAVPDDEWALQYNENMKAQLDRLNPDAVPNFLKDQNIDLDPIKSLKNSEVPEFAKEKDEEATEEALAQDKKYQEEKAKWEMMQSMMNPLFGGFNFSGVSNSKNEGDEKSPQSSPNLAEAELSSPQPGSSSYWVDEEGNIYLNNDFDLNPPWGQCVHQCGFNLPSCPGSTCCEMAATCFI